MAQSNNLKRQHLTYKDKITILKELEKGTSRDDILKTYKISRSCFYHIIKNKEDITMLLNKEEFQSKKSKRSSKDKTLDECLFTWFLQAKAMRQPISGPILQAKALQLNNLLEGSSDFKASNGWLDRFKNRHGIRLMITDEILSNNVEAAKIFYNEIIQKIKTEDLLLENVYNADESGIYWKSFPNIILTSQKEKSEEKSPGKKEYNDRITVLFCSNAAGTNKIRLCITEKSAEPKSIKNIKNLPIIYKSQESWMSQDMFKEWYQDNFIPEVLEYQKKNNITGKVLLLLSNTPSHPSVGVLNNINKNFEVKYLPNAVKQPLDQGIISTIKKSYKKLFLLKLILEGKQLNIEDFLSNFTLIDCIILISNAWKNIESSTLSKAWKPMLGNLLLIHTHNNSANNENNESVEESVELCSCISQQLKRDNIDISEIKKWIAIEECDEGLIYLTDTEIIENVINCNQVFVKVENEKDNFFEEISDQSLKKVSHTQAYQSLQVVKKWCEQQDDCEIADILVINKLLEIAETKAMHEKLEKI